MSGANEQIKKIVVASSELGDMLNELMSKEDIDESVFASMGESVKQFHGFRLWFADAVNLKRHIDACAIGNANKDLALKQEAGVSGNN